MKKSTGKHYTLGLSRRVGPRPQKFKPTKGELYDAIVACKALGFGNDYIAMWAGYSSSMIASYCQDLDIEPVDASRRFDVWFQLLPADLQRQLTAIRIKSEVAHERATNRESATRAVATHKLVDDSEVPCVNSSRRRAPKIPRNFSLGEMMKGLP